MPLLVLALFFLLGLTQAMAGNQCPGREAPMPEVRIILSLPDVTENHKLSWKDFILPDARVHGQDTLGLSKTRDIVQYVPRIEYAKQGGHVCAYVTSVEMTFGFQYREIFIAKEAPRGSCLYKEIRAHEYRHAAIDAHVVQKYAPWLKTQLLEATTKNSVVRARTGKDAARIAAERILSSMRASVEHVIERKNAMQRRVDTPEEYARISSICRIDIQNFIK